MSGFSIALAVVGWFSSVVIFCAYFPGTWKTMRTRQTFFLSQNMWILTVISLFCFVIYGAFLGMQAKVDNWGVGAVASGFAMVCFDGMNFIMCSTILGYKIYNKQLAKKLNISEKEVCAVFLNKHQKIKEEYTNKNN